ncbi:hypothetical protein FRB94_000647 [Tulasnella sp. JGI-2019a]|nr:hypothetical protein FRB93_011976 [Tulasnella sp. JGI-2019a]KAG9006553.1 hypothetical protein FRB94_000647 [Tulasnella sp. JGI-2019a]KAG9032869.1 hypothetical protein FRB95_000884 [Tulasnella sp. JGI-2019a]
MSKATRKGDSPLLAILLVTSSASGSNLVWSWPPCPKPSIRLIRPRPIEWEKEPDVSWRACHDFDQNISNLTPESRQKVIASLSDHASKDRNFDYEWRRRTTEDPHIYKTSQRPSTVSVSGSRPDSGRSSPSQDRQGVEAPTLRDDNSYGEILGYDPTFLAEVLSPKPALCHQKFELSVDELAFVGYPVFIGKDGRWGWDEVYAAGPSTPGAVPDDKDHRGRTLDRPDEMALLPTEISLSPELPMNHRILPPLPTSQPKKRASNAISSFHLVLALDRPDPSSIASSGLYRFVDMYYRQVAFKLTAAMHYEQGRVDFVGQQAALISSLRESCLTKGSTLDSFVSQALFRSTLASAIKTVFLSVSSNNMANVTINEIPVHIQLPPQHVAYLRGDLENEEEAQMINELQIDEAEQHAHDAQGRWADEIQYGWRIPPLLPWKAILILTLDGHGGAVDDLVESVWVNGNRGVEQGSKDMFRRFVGIAFPTLSLSDIAALLDLDLDSEVYPMARLLVYHRKAKIIDVIPPSLKNIYAPPASLTGSLTEHAQAFSKLFGPRIPPLYVHLSTLSASHQAFSNIVPTPEDRTIYTDVLIWMLQRDLLVMLHVRIRIVATAGIKEKVRRDRRREEKERRRKLRMEAGRDDDDNDDASSGSENSTCDEGEEKSTRYGSESPELDKASASASSPEASLHNRRRRRRSSANLRQKHMWPDDGDDLDDAVEEEEEFDYYSDEYGEDSLEPTLICRPSRATRLERKWLEAMMEGKSESACHMFERLYVYFDGKKTTDEILFRTEMSRRQLREVLHQFEEYLITFLHP